MDHNIFDKELAKDKGKKIKSIKYSFQFFYLKSKIIKLKKLLKIKLIIQEYLLNPQIIYIKPLLQTHE